MLCYVQAILYYLSNCGVSLEVNFTVSFFTPDSKQLIYENLSCVSISRNDRLAGVQKYGYFKGWVHQQGDLGSDRRVDQYTPLLHHREITQRRWEGELRALLKVNSYNYQPSLKANLIHVTSTYKHPMQSYVTHRHCKRGHRIYAITVIKEILNI